MAKVVVVVGRGPAAVDAGVKAWNFQMEKTVISHTYCFSKIVSYQIWELSSLS